MSRLMIGLMATILFVLIGFVPPAKTYAINDYTVLFNTIANASPDDVIILTGDIYISAAIDNEQNAFPPITHALTINGNGYRIQREQSAGEFRFFHVTDTGHLTVENLILQGGFQEWARAGAIYNQGTLTVINTHFYANVGGVGGAIFNSRTAVVRNSTFYNNFASWGGGAIMSGSSPNASLDVENSIFAENRVDVNNGGAIDNSEKMRVVNSTFYGNVSPEGRAINDIEGGSIIHHNTFFANKTNHPDDSFSGVSLAIPASASFNNNLIYLESPEYMCYTDFDGVGNLTNAFALNCQTTITTGLTQFYVGVLGHHGGPTPTIPLIGTGNPAIDPSGNQNVDGRDTDQRGAVTIYNRDRGAYEAGADLIYPNVSGQDASYWRDDGVVALTFNVDPSQDFGDVGTVRVHDNGTGTAVQGVDYQFTSQLLTVDCTGVSCVTSPVYLTILSDALTVDAVTVNLDLYIVDGFATIGDDNLTVTIQPLPELTPEPTDTLTPEPTDTLTPDPTDTLTPEPTDTLTPDPTDTLTPDPTDTLTPDPTDTLTPDPTDTLTPIYPSVIDVVGANGVSLDGVTYTVNLDELTIRFNMNVFDDGTGTDEDSASNPANYRLLREGDVAGFQTESCVGGVSSEDEQIHFASIRYDEPITTLTFNPALADGDYRLIICGTTSIVSADDVTARLNNGADVWVAFTIDTTVPTTLTAVPSATSLPTVSPVPTIVAPSPAPVLQPEELGAVELPATGERPLWAELLARWLGW